MRTKTWLKKWLVVAVTMMLLITALGISAVPVLADDPPLPPDTSLIVTAPGTNGTYFDAQVMGGPKIPGWCAQEHETIQLDTFYIVKAIDYFGVYYPNDSILPLAVKYLPWKKIAYIINHKQGTPQEIQQAIWYIAGPVPSELVAGPIKNMFDGANANPNFVPGPGQLRPIIYYYDDSTQIVFSEFLTSDVVPPVPEMPAGALLALGLAGVGGYIFIMKRRATAVS